jgi:AcrR family transcriptional regulator
LLVARVSSIAIAKRSVSAEASLAVFRFLASGSEIGLQTARATNPVNPIQWCHQPKHKRDIEHSVLWPSGRQRAGTIEKLNEMAHTSLRPLALALGTTDRMLLYYFRDKEELLTLALELVAQRLAAMLEASRTSSAPQSFKTLFSELWVALQSEVVTPYMNLWIELCGAAVRKREPETQVATKVAEFFLYWIEQRLTVSKSENRKQQAVVTTLRSPGAGKRLPSASNAQTDPAVARFVPANTKAARAFANSSLSPKLKAS